MGLANGRWRPTPTATRPASIRPLRKSSAFPPLPACEERSGRVSARVKGPLRRRFFRIRPLTLPSPRMRGEETKTTPRSPPTASPQRSRRSPDCSPKAIHSSRTAKPGRRTARRGPKNPKAASASPSSPTSSPPATSRRAIAELVDGVGARSATRCCSASPAPARPSPWPRSSRRRSARPSSSRPTRRWRPSSTASSRAFFPDNAVEYFVSYYDYYQPEAYVPRTDTYIEKESSINEQIDRMRHSATRALLERDDVIIVASVSCIYGIGSVETYTAMTFSVKVGEQHRPAPADRRPRRPAVQAQPERFRPRHLPRARRHDRDLSRPTTRTAPGASPCSATRSSSIVEFDPLTGKKTTDLESSRSTPTPTTSRRARPCSRPSRASRRSCKQRLRRARPAGPAAGSPAPGAAHAPSTSR